MIILIVEDAPEIVALWKRLLSSVGSDFRSADNIQDALAEMERQPFPDLVLLDLRIHGSTPEETLAKIDKFKEVHPATVVLVVTGNPDQSLVLLAEKFGADGYEQKIAMATQDRLLSAVKNAFARGIPAATSKPYERRVALLERLTGLVTHEEKSDTAGV